jgi:hypothetical protein
MSDRGRVIASLWALLAISLGAAVTTAAGQESASAPASPAEPKLSPRVSEVIRSELPRYVSYVPPSETEIAAELETWTAEMKDDTLHLPKMTVREVVKAPVTSTDWFTNRGRMDYALKRFPGTRIGNIFGLNNPWAWARLTEDIEAERHEALKERGNSVLRIENTAEDRENKKLLDAALSYSGRPPP